MALRRIFASLGNAHARFSLRAFSGWKSDSDISNLPQLKPDEARHAAERDAALRGDHFRLKTDIPEHSHGVEEGRDPLEIRKRRLIYRSKQRGWLEVDLLLGTYATEFVPGMTEDEMDQYEAILNQETIDIFQYVTAAEEPPEFLKTPMLDKLREFASASPVGKASPETYAAVKARSSLT